MHPLWARSVDQRGTHRHPHERFLVDGVLGLWRQRHMTCHVLVVTRRAIGVDSFTTLLYVLIVMLRDRQPSSSDTSSSLTSMTLSRTATTRSPCNGAPVVLFWMKSLCLASRHNAQQGRNFVDRHLRHGLSIRLQDFLLAVILVHDGSIRLAHNLVHRHLRHRNWPFDLWLGTSTVFSTICVTICGTRMAISSTCGLAAGTTTSSGCSPFVAISVSKVFPAIHLLTVLHLWSASLGDSSVACSVSIGPSACEAHCSFVVTSSSPLSRSTVSTTACRVTNFLAGLRGYRENQEHHHLCHLRSAARPVTFAVTLLPWLRDHGSATMRDFIVSCSVLGSFVVVSVFCGAWSVSYPQPPTGARVYCGY